MKKGTKKCPKCKGYFRSQGFKGHVASCDGTKKSTNGKKRKRCPHCNELFATKSGGWCRHVRSCQKNPRRIPGNRTKGPQPRPEPQKLRGKRTYLVAAFRHNDVRLSLESDINDILTEMIGNDIPESDIEIYEIAKSYKIKSSCVQFDLEEVK